MLNKNHQSFKANNGILFILAEQGLPSAKLI